MKWSRVLALAAWLCSGVVWGATTVDVSTDRTDGLYAAGEPVTFTITVATDGKPAATGKLNWQLSKDGVGDLGRGQADLSGQPVKVEGKLGEPGVLRLTVRCQVGTEKLDALGGAAIDSGKIQPAVPAPADFDEYWAAQKKLLAAVPLQPELKPSAKHSNAKADVIEFALPLLDGGKIRGWFCRPKAPGKYPAILSVPGAGVGPTGPARWFGESGYLSINISVHDQPLDGDAEFYRKLNDNELKGYPGHGKASRDSYYYRRVFLGFVRCIDFLTSQADWDGKHMIVVGSSQGGGSALVAAGLDSRVTAASSNVPALCDHKGPLAGRVSGWPHLIRSADDKATIETMGYYDAAYFAQRIKCPMLVSVGLIDRTCPPTTVFAAFNGIPGADKKLLIFPKMGHAVSPEFSKAQTEFIARHSR